MGAVLELVLQKANDIFDLKKKFAPPNQKLPHENILETVPTVHALYRGEYKGGGSWAPDPFFLSSLE